MYLVQRCTKKFKVYKNETVSEAFSLDYMGSSEFEFGAIPKSIRKLAQKNLVQTSFKHKSKNGKEYTIYVLADHEEQGEAVKAIRDYLNAPSPYRQLKEFIHLWGLVNEDKTRENYEETFWWCVDENSNCRVKGKTVEERDEDAMRDGVINFAFSLDPEQCRAFKLAVKASREKYNADLLKKAA